MTVSMAADRPTSPAFGYSDPQESKPVSDFTPLPPIRRTSTFDLMTRKKLGGGDEDDNAPSPVGSSDNEIPPAPPMKEGPGYQNGNRQMPNQPLAGQASAQLNQPRNLIQPPPQQHPAFANGSAHAPNGFAPAGGAAQFNGMQQQMLVRRGGPVGPQPVRTQGRPNGTPAHIPGQPSMSQMGGNPVQKLPPGGRQWKLEESYLSEPLKNRPGASSPPQQHQSGFDPYDKETEDGTPQRVARSRPRNNSNNVPPISAGRFPNLFAAPEQPQGPQVGHPVYRGQSNESERQSEQNARDAGLAKEMDDPSGPGEEQRRRGSGIFGLNPPKPSSTWEHDEKPPSMKKRLSELRGMIKGVGNAKDGAKDDQPTKPSTSHVSRPSMQGPIRSQGPGGQGPSPLSQPPLGIGRTGTNESAPAEYQNANGEDEHRKPGGGFLGGLFNKPGSKQPDPKQQPNQPTPSSFQRPPQQFMQPGQQIRPGQMVPEGPPSGQRLVYPSGQPFNGVQPGRPGAMQPVLPDQANPQESIQSPTSPHLVGMAQAVMIRRPSEITVSSQSQAGGPQLSPSRMHQMASQQGPQPGMRAPAGEDVGLSSLRRQIGGGDGDVLVSGALPKPSLGLSHRPSQERLDQGGSSTSNRTTPNRKPVGSGFLRQDGTPTAAAALKYGDSEPRPASAEDERRSSSQLPSGQQSPTLGKIGHVRQTSLPSPGHPLMPSQTQGASPLAVGGLQQPPRGLPSAQGRPYGVPQAQTGVPQPGQGPTGFISSSMGPGPQPDSRSPQFRNPISAISNWQRPGTPNQNLQGSPPRPPGGPTEQQNVMAKASKFFNAFKRGSKQSEQSQTREQQRPPPGHQIAPHTLRPLPPGGLQPGVMHPPISGPSPPGPMGNLPPNSLQPLQGPDQMFPPQGFPGRGPLPPSITYGPGRGSAKPSRILGLQPTLSHQQRRASTQRFEPQYDKVPIPRGYEAVHGYGNPGGIAPSPYNVGRPSPPPAPQQFQLVMPHGAAPQQQDPRTAQAMAGMYGRPPNQQGWSQSTPGQTDSASTTPTPSEQGTFLDMAPTPPPPQSHEETRRDRVPPQGIISQASYNQLSQQPQLGTQISSQHIQGPDTPTPSSSNWGSAPDSARGPPSQGNQNSLAKVASIHAKPSDPNISPPSESGDMSRSQPQHIATAMSSNPQQATPPGHPSSAQTFSPMNPPSRQLPSPPMVQVPDEQRPGSAAAGRLVSKMSVNNEAPRSTSLSPEVVANRATSVSPEPPGTRPSPYHQVSNNSLNINVDRANDTTVDSEEDMYDATPRMNNSQARDPAHENTKYAGSERGRPVVNGGVVAGGAAAGGAVAAADLALQDSRSEESTPPQIQIQMSTEPEEKILVDEPVELAAVNVEDSIPEMSATSYPGQEWNPYAAGEFGDWD